MLSFGLLAAPERNRFAVVRNIDECSKVSSMFILNDPGKLVDNDFELILVEKYLGNLEINFVPAYKFEMRLISTGRTIGTVELRAGTTNHIVMYGGHFAYWVKPEHRGQHYAARSCKLLFPLAQSHNLNPLWITCNPDNIASAKTCELAGAKLVEIVDLPEDTDMYQEGEPAILILKN